MESLLFRRLSYSQSSLSQWRRFRVGRVRYGEEVAIVGFWGDLRKVNVRGVKVLLSLIGCL